MKKIILMITLVFTMNAQAGFRNGTFKNSVTSQPSLVGAVTQVGVGTVSPKNTGGIVASKVKDEAGCAALGSNCSWEARGGLKGDGSQKYECWCVSKNGTNTFEGANY